MCWYVLVNVSVFNLCDCHCPCFRNRRLLTPQVTAPIVFSALRLSNHILLLLGLVLFKASNPFSLAMVQLICISFFLKQKLVHLLHIPQFAHQFALTSYIFLTKLKDRVWISVLEGKFNFHIFQYPFYFPYEYCHLKIMNYNVRHLNLEFFCTSKTP